MFQRHNRVKTSFLSKHPNLLLLGYQTRGDGFVFLDVFFFNGFYDGRSPLNNDNICSFFVKHSASKSKKRRSFFFKIILKSK